MSEKTRRTLIFALLLLAAAIILCSWFLFRKPDRRPNPKYTCLSNLKAIESAKANWALDQRKSDDAVPTDADLFGSDRYIEVKLTCPAGGTYILGKVSEKPRCTFAGHVLFP
jgi:hypothetical protein